MSCHYLITAGPTHEPIDAVRYLANRSSGAVGLALAQAARDAGHRVTLLLGPVAAEPPAGVTVKRFQSAADLQALLDADFGQCDVLIMAAAVADYRPAKPAAGKLPRTDERLTIELEPIPDLVAACAAQRRADQFFVGFALEEPADLDRRAAGKLQRKALDAIVANPLKTMGADEIDATILSPGRPPCRPGTLSKPAFAQQLIRWIDQHRPQDTTN